MKSMIIILAMMVLFAIGCTGEHRENQLETVPPLSPATCPDVFQWTGIGGTGRYIAHEIAPNGHIGERLIEAEVDVDGLAIQSDGRIAYSHMLLGREHVCPFQLRVREGIGKPERILFVAPETIHSLSWSPDGKRLAFFVGDAKNPGGWFPQQLFIVNTEANSEPATICLAKTTIQTPSEFYRDMFAPQIVWSEDSQFLYWIDNDRQVVRAALSTGKQDRVGNAECVLAFKGKSLFIARKNPWRLVRRSVDTEVESKIAVFEHVEAIGLGVLVPNSSVLAVVVSDRQPRKYMKNPWMPTLFVDLESGRLCGRIGEPIVGFCRTNSISSGPSGAAGARAATEAVRNEH